MNDRCIPVTPETVREARTPGTILNQLIAEYGAELTKRGVPAEMQLSADELLLHLKAVGRQDDDAEPFLGVDGDYEGLAAYLSTFLDRWEKASQLDRKARAWTTDGRYMELSLNEWWDTDGTDIVDEATVDAHMAANPGVGIMLMTEAGHA